MRNSKTLRFVICAALGWMCGGFADFCPAQSGFPLTTYAIFYNGVLEFSTCSTMTVNGPVHCNTNIDVGAGSGALLTFNALVTASGTISAPTNNGQSWTDPTNYNSGWRTIFNSNYVENSPLLPTPVLPAISLIQIPTTNNPTTPAGKQLLYNEAQVILIVSNQVAGKTTNTLVILAVQAAPNSASVPGADPSPIVVTYTNPTPSSLSNTLPFLSLTNHFYDGRQESTNNTTQINVGQYAQWLTNSILVAMKYPANGLNGYPTILFVADNRITNSSYALDVVRLTNGIAPPSNGGEGFSVATPNPLYIMGNYNQTDPAYLGTTNTSSGTVPCAFYSDALTILSTNWNDSNSLHSSFSIFPAWNAAPSETVNAAIVTGIVPSTGSDMLHFSGGIHNLPRLLEDWSGSTLTLNTSIINLFNSAKATGQFVDPGTYYEPPTRQYSYDRNFSNPAKAPPGMVVQTCPVITFTPAILADGTVGMPYNQPIAANGGVQPYAFEVRGGNLPPGLTFSTLFSYTGLPPTVSTSGFLAGTPTNSGSYCFTVTATDAYGCTASQDYTVEVLGGAVITVQPLSQSVPVGGNVNLIVAATGDPSPTYQWYFNSAAISGAASNSLELDDFQATNEGDYYVVVSNEFESVTSAPAQLYVSEPLRLVNPFVDSNGWFWVSVVGPAGTNFVVDGSTDLLNWTSLATNTAPYGVVPFTDTNQSGAPERFYRAWLLP